MKRRDFLLLAIRRICGIFSVWSAENIKANFRKTWRVAKVKYIHELKIWPHFVWDYKTVAPILAETRNHQGRLLGRMEALGFDLRSEAILKTLTMDILKNSEIEGEILPEQAVRSSIARKLGLNVAGLVASDRHVDGVVEMMLDATQNFNQTLTADRMFGWHNCLFPSGRSGLHKITVADWRTDKNGPMTVVSGPIGREKIHYQAPDAKRLKKEMFVFFNWLEKGNKKANDLDPVLKAAIAHFWFIIIHPFDDGNGRIARALTDLLLARADGSKERFYSMSTQILKERKAYYKTIQSVQNNLNTANVSQGFSEVLPGKASEGIDITLWITWFLKCLNTAILSTEETLEAVFLKARFWKKHENTILNDRQKTMINKLFDGFEGKFTTSKWAKITKCHQDTAHRDILSLIDKGIMMQNPGGGRSTSYSLIFNH